MRMRCFGWGMVVHICIHPDIQLAIRHHLTGTLPWQDGDQEPEAVLITPCTQAPLPLHQRELQQLSIGTAKQPYTCSIKLLHAHAPGVVKPVDMFNSGTNLAQINSSFYSGQWQYSVAGCRTNSSPWQHCVGPLANRRISLSGHYRGIPTLNSPTVTQQPTQKRGWRCCIGKEVVS